MMTADPDPRRRYWLYRCLFCGGLNMLAGYEWPKAKYRCRWCPATYYGALEGMPLTCKHSESEAALMEITRYDA